MNHEDIAFKSTMQMFADEVLPFLGIAKKGELRVAAPTEVIYLEAKQMYQDFDFYLGTLPALLYHVGVSNR